MSSPETQASHNRYLFLADAVAWRYRAQGFAVRRQVRAKLLRDPFYRALLLSNRLPADGSVLDLGCGRGIFLAFVASARALGMAGDGKRGSPPCLTGIESRPDQAESARLALAGLAEIISGDVRNIDLPPCRTAILQDVLLFLPPEAQDSLLSRLVAALEPGGLIILREPDAGVFWRNFIIRLAASAGSLFQGEKDKRPYPRSAEEWAIRLAALGLEVEKRPLEDGTWLSNTLLLAKKPNATLL